ncbi:hypothetical protein Vafri_6962, partial [Volvox africanus]
MASGYGSRPSSSHSTAAGKGTAAAAGAAAAAANGEKEEVPISQGPAAEPTTHTEVSYQAGAAANRSRSGSIGWDAGIRRHNSGHRVDSPAEAVVGVFVSPIHAAAPGDEQGA